MSVFIRKEGADLVIEVSVLNSNGDGVTSVIAVTASIERTVDGFFWDSGPPEFASGGEPSLDTMIHDREGLYAFVLVGGAESSERSYKIHLVITGGIGLNAGVNINALFSDMILGVPTVGDATLANQTTILSNQTSLAAQNTAIDNKTTNLPGDPASETNVNANETKIDALAAQNTAIDAKTQNLPGDPASETNVDANETKIDQILSTGGTGPWTSGAVGAVTLDDNPANRIVLDKILDALRADHLVNGSFGEFAPANVVRWAGAATIDGVSLTLFFDILLAYVNGRFKVNFPVDGQIQFFARDNTTPIFTMNLTDIERTRL